MTARHRRLLRWFGAVLLAVAVALVCSGWWLLAGSRAQLDGHRAMPGLHNQVTLQRDALGTLTVTGTDRGDVSYALGFVHAQERFFAMDLMRRVAAGELAALLGPRALPLDLDHRRHRLRAVVHAAYLRLPADQQVQLQRYRDGVNAGLAALRVKPWEYLLLRAQPRPWQVDDSMLMIAAMYMQLQGDGGNVRELRLAQMRAVLPGPLADFLLAPDPDWEAPLQGPLSRRPVLPGTRVIDLRAQPARPASASLAVALRPATQSHYAGSNSFAVAGRLTANGAALLANDMHLHLGVPNIWYRTRLHYPDPTAPDGQRDLNGVSLPGMPALVVGSNGQVAWGFTNSAGDWADWVRVLRDPDDPERYRVPDGWARIEHRTERIAVKGGADVVLDVAQTRWGPIMGTDVDGTPLALSWVGAQPHAYNLDLVRMEHVATVGAALDLGPQLGIPAQNLLVADHAGHIGWTIASNSLPLRGQADPLLPADWSSAGTGWQGWAEARQYPRIEDPPSGRLWTANNRTVGGNALTLLGNGGYDLGARAQQIRNDLNAHRSFVPGNLTDIQLDDRAVLLTRWQRLLQSTLADTTDPGLQQLRRLTANWQGRAATRSVDYRLVREFRIQVTDAALAPFVAMVRERYPDFAWPQGSPAEAAVWMLIRARPQHLLDRQYADWHALLLAAARQVVATLGTQPGGLAARSWGEHNRSAIRHPLAPALPGWLAHFIDMPDQPLPGDRDMPRVAAPGFGASERMAVSPGDEVHASLGMPGGQSDNPLSPFFGAGHEAWVRGQATPLLPGPARHTLILTPASR
ncbi:MAG: penicillin acylase family protein [Xanthomonadales bacterium]|nr:penicillin acylase family protein [Xanthomonadales bacterium]